MNLTKNELATFKTPDFKRITRGLWTLVILLINLSCSKDDLNHIENQRTRETIDPTTDAYLMQILPNLSGENPTGRTMNTEFGQLSLNSAVKITDPSDSSVTYTLRIESGNTYSEKNLVIKEKDNEVYPYILEYNPDKNWIQGQSLKVVFDNYTGIITSYDIYGRAMEEISMKNGESVSVKYVYDNTNSRTQCDEGEGTGEGDSGGSSGGTGSGGSTGGGSGGDSGGGGGPVGGTPCWWTIENGELFIDCPGEEEPPVDHFARTLCDDSGLLGGGGSGGGYVGVGSGEDVEFIYVIRKQLTNPCADSVFTQLQRIEGGDIRKIIDRFAGEESEFEWIMKNADHSELDEPGHSAETKEVSRFSYRTLISNTYLANATRLAIARTMLHEGIHAYILSYISLAGTGNSGALESYRNFTEMWDEMINEVYGDPMQNQEQYQHEEMARRYVKAIADALEQWDSFSLSRQYYEDIAWGGLLGTKAFTHSTTLTPEDKTRIKNRNNSEDLNTLNAQGDDC